MSTVSVNNITNLNSFTITGNLQIQSGSLIVNEQFVIGNSSYINVNSIGFYSNVGFFYPYYANSTNHCYMTASSGSLVLGTGTAGVSERVRISPTGNVAIGSSNTSYGRLRVETTGNGNWGRQAPSLVLVNDFDVGLRLLNSVNTSISVSMFMPAAGGLGITCNNNNAFEFYCDSSGNFTARANITAYSDIRLKTDIETISNSLEKVKSIRGVKYRRVDVDQVGIGFIAQEIEKYVPEVIMESLDGYKTVSYGNLTALLVEAIKEQQSIIASLESRISSLEKKSSCQCKCME